MMNLLIGSAGEQIIGSSDILHGRNRSQGEVRTLFRVINQMDVESSPPPRNEPKPSALDGVAKVVFYIFIGYLTILTLINVIEVFSTVRVYKVPVAIAALGGTITDLGVLTKSALYHHSGIAIRLLLGIGLVIVLFPFKSLVFLYDRVPKIFIPNTAPLAQASCAMALWGLLGGIMSYMGIPVGFDAASSSLYLVPALLWVLLQGGITAMIFWGFRRSGASPTILILALISFNLASLATENIILSTAKLVTYAPLRRTPGNHKLFELAAAEDFPEQRLLRQWHYSGLPSYSDGLLTEIITLPNHLSGDEESFLGHLAGELGRRRTWNTHKHYALRAIPLIISPIVATLFVLPSAAIFESFGLTPETPIAAFAIADLITGAVSMMLDPFKLWFFRHDTYAADSHAKRLGYGKQLAVALAKNTQDDTLWCVSWIYEKLFMPTPSALHRIEELTK